MNLKLLKVYINLFDQKEPMLNFQNSDSTESSPTKKKIIHFKKIIRPSDSEIENHKNYLKENLKKNFF